MARKRRLISSKGSLAGAKHLQKRQLARSRKELGVTVKSSKGSPTRARELQEEHGKKTFKLRSRLWKQS